MNTATDARVSADRLVRLIQSHRYVYMDEAELQQALAEMFAEHRLPARREVPLGGPRDRIDFLVDRLGVEVKVAGSVMAVSRQLQRYARTGRLAGLVLVTAVAVHRQVPSILGGVPVFHCSILNGAL